jgi:hypothetical protein
MLWRQALTTSLQLQSSCQLRRPLGHWLPTQMQCCCFFDRGCERLCQRHGNLSTYYPRAPGRSSRAAVMKFSLRLPPPGIPVAADQAIAERFTPTIWLTGHSSTTVLDDSPLAQNTLTKQLSRLVPDTSWAAQQVLTADEESAIVAAIRAGTCTLVSDGSFKEKHGTAAWVIEA